MSSKISPKKSRRMKQDLINLLDFEIGRIEASTSWTGRNYWILLGGLTASLGLFLTEIESSSFEPQKILYLLLLWTLSYDVLGIFSWLVTPPQKNYSPLRLFTTKTYASPSREGIVLVIFRCIGLVFVTWLLSDKISYPLFEYIFYIVFLLVSLIVLRASALDLPISPNQRNKRALAINTTMFILGVLGIADLALGWIYGSFSSVGMANVRASGALFVALISLTLLAQQKSYAHLYESLKKVRRELALGYINMQKAFEQTELLLTGMTPKDALGGYLKESIVSSKNLSRFWDNRREIEASKDEHPNLQEAFATIIKIIKEEFSVTRKCINDFLNLERQIMTINKISPKFQDELAEVIASLNQNFITTFKKGKDKKYPINILKKRLERMSSKITNI